MKQISNRIFELLKAQGKSQRDLSKFTGIKETTISQWKADGTNPQSEYIAIIAQYFGVSTDYLLGRTDNPQATVEGFPLNETQFYDELKQHGITDEDYKNLPPERKKLLFTLIKEVVDNSKNKK